MLFFVTFFFNFGICFIMDNKKEKLLRNLISNFVIVLFVAIFGFISFYSFNDNVVASSNKEYNGTIYGGDTTKNNVSLMINVYWGTEYVETMLDILKKYNVKTTFFIGGTWAKENQEVLKRIQNEGHEIASHGTNHKEHGKISYEQNLTEIQTCHEIVKHITGLEMELFAPPGGSYNKNTTKAAEFLGYKTIMWTRDTIDWRDKNTSLIYNRAVVNMSGGDLILIHPTANTVEALTNIICYAQNHNFKLTTVSETLGLA